jgi:hypothetical protein
LPAFRTPTAHREIFSVPLCLRRNADPGRGIRAPYQAFAGWLERTPADRIAQKRDEAERAFHRVGITFAVYGEDSGMERLIPFDLVPRIIAADEWRILDRGLKQRVQALNAFLGDIYHDQAILKAGVVPSERVLGNVQYRREMHGMKVPGGIYAHIAGIDIVRAGAGEFYVLEDNLRVPSGVSYMLENRKMMMRLFPELFSTQRIRPVQHYPDLLLANLPCVAPDGEERADGRRAHAGRTQFRLLRACVPRTANGGRAGRGGRTSSSRTRPSTCARRAGRSVCTSSTAASMTTSWTRARFAPIRCSGVRACSRRTAPAA